MTQQSICRPARRDHRRHVGPGTRARPRTARPRRARRLRRAQPRRRGARVAANCPAPTASSETSRGRKTSIRSRSRCSAPSAASTSSINNASVARPVPLAPLADTECEDLERALATNLLGPFRLTKALLGSLAASAREGRAAARHQHLERRRHDAYPGWGAYGASKAALHHLSRIWDEELAGEGIASCPSIPAIWTRRCTRSPSPTPIARR